MKYKSDKEIKKLKIRPTGYYLYYRFNQQRRAMKLCSLDLPIKTARDLAIKNLKLISGGVDPMNKTNEPTFADSFGFYLQKLENKKSSSVKEYKRIYALDLEKEIGNKLLKDITEFNIQQLHDKITQRAPVVANRTVELIKAVFNHAKFPTNPANHIDKNLVAKRKRYLTEEELGSIVKILNAKVKHPDFLQSVAFIWLLIFTGARKSEIANATWSDLQDDKLTIKNHKTMRYGDDRVIYLSKQAMNVINALPRTSGTIVGIKSPRRLWENIRKEINAPDLRIHDLRHSYASFGVGLDMNLSMIGNLLGHRDIAATQRYAHIHEKVSVENAQKIGDHIQKIIMNS